MKTLALLLFGILTVLAGADDLTTDAELARYASSDAKKLGELLAENWIVETSGKVVTLTSKFEVFHVGMVSRPSSPPNFSDTTPRALLLEEAKPEKYVITLRYERKISPEELEIRRVARQKAVDALNNGTKTKEEHGNAAKENANNKMPRYESDLCHIYEELPDTVYGRFYPPKSVQKVGGAKEILSVYLGRIRSAND